MLFGGIFTLTPQRAWADAHDEATIRKIQIMGHDDSRAFSDTFQDPTQNHSRFITESFENRRQAHPQQIDAALIPSEHALVASEAAEDVYLLYRFFRCGYLRSSSRVRSGGPTPAYGTFDAKKVLCERPVDITPTHLNGKVVSFAFNDLPKEFSALSHLRSQYKAAHLFCSAISKSECGSFAVLYLDSSAACFRATPQSNGCLTPVLAFKGSSSPLDWEHNIRNRGAQGNANLLQDLIEILLPASRTRTQSELKSSVGHALLRALENSSRLDTDQQKLIVTGHSSGGALAQNFVTLLDRLPTAHRHRTFDLVTFNSLGKSGMSDSLLRFFNVQPASLNQVRDLLSDGINSTFDTLSDRVRAVNYYAVGDPLDNYNRLTGLKNLGISVRIPTLRGLDSEGLLMKSSSAAAWFIEKYEAHSVKTAAREMREARSNLHLLRLIYPELLSEKPAAKRILNNGGFNGPHSFAPLHCQPNQEIPATYGWEASARWIYKIVIGAQSADFFPQAQTIVSK